MGGSRLSGSGQRSGPMDPSARAGRLAGIAPAAAAAADRLADVAARRGRADPNAARLRAAAKGDATATDTAAQTHTAPARPPGIGGSRRTGSQTGRQAQGRPAGSRQAG